MSTSNGTPDNSKGKEPDVTDQQVQDTLQVLSIIRSRADLASRIGETFGGKRDIYEALGYKKALSSADLIAKWKRQDFARAIVDRPTKATWQGDLFISESTEEDETPLEKEYKSLSEDLNLKTMFFRLDRLSQLGKYAVMLLGFDDSSPETWMLPVTEGDRKLMYTKVISQTNAEISTWEEDPTNPRYGKPRLYNIRLQKPGQKEESTSLTVHYSRVIHVASDLLENDIEGVPVMEAVYNRLEDLEKLIGGSAEMFWRGARPGYAGSAQEGYKVGDKTKSDLKQQIEEYEHDLRRVLVSEGVDLKSLAQQIADPKGHAEIQLQAISSITGIPVRILVGSERGQLASSQDDSQWKEWIEGRRLEQAEPLIVRPFVDRMISHGVLAEPLSTEQGYSVNWSDLFTIDDGDKADIGQKRSNALKSYMDSGAEMMMPLYAYLRYILKMDEDECAQIIELRDEQLREMAVEEDQLQRELEEEPEESTEEQPENPETLLTDGSE